MHDFGRQCPTAAVIAMMNRILGRRLCPPKSMPLPLHVGMACRLQCQGGIKQRIWCLLA